MAVKLNYEDEKYGLVKNAYCKLIHINGNKDKLYYSMHVYKSDEKSKVRDKVKVKGIRVKNYNDPYLKVINESFEPDLKSKDNLLKQCYLDFKNKYNKIVKGDI